MLIGYMFLPVVLSDAVYSGLVDCVKCDVCFSCCNDSESLGVTERDSYVSYALAFVSWCVIVLCFSLVVLLVLCVCLVLVSLFLFYACVDSHPFGSVVLTALQGVVIDLAKFPAIAEGV